MEPRRTLNGPAWTLTIARVEGRVFHDNPRNGDQKADRAWILDTYVECIKATRGVRSK